MKVLYRTDTDYIVLPSKDPFVQAQQPFLIEMGYRLIEDWEPPGCTDSEDSVLSSAAQTADPSVSETAETEETFTTASGKTVTKTELEALLKNL